MLLIKAPRGVKWYHLAALTLFAFSSSYYINKPIIDKIREKQLQLEQEQALKTIKESETLVQKGI